MCPLLDIVLLKLDGNRLYKFKIVFLVFNEDILELIGDYGKLIINI